MTARLYHELNDTVYFWFGANDTSGSGGDGATPLADVRLAGAAASAAPVLSPTPVLLTDAGYPAGSYELAVAATSGNGFAADSTYAVFSTLTIDSQNPTGFIGSFTLSPVLSNVQEWLDTAPNALVSGAVDADVSNLQTGVIVATSFTAGAINNTALGTNSIGSNTLSTSAIDEIADACWLTQMSDSVPADGTIATREQAQYMILQMLTEFAISSTTMTVKKVDGSTTLITLTLDDDTNPTSLTRAT